MKIEDLTRVEQCVIHCIAHIEQLIDKGLMSGPKTLTPDGWTLFRELEKSDFQITDDERRQAMAIIMGAHKPQEQPA